MPSVSVSLLTISGCPTSNKKWHNWILGAPWHIRVQTTSTDHRSPKLLPSGGALRGRTWLGPLHGPVRPWWPHARLRADGNIGLSTVAVRQRDRARVEHAGFIAGGMRQASIASSDRVWLFYGQPYGGAPYGRFSDRSFFSFFSKFFVVFWFQEFFSRKNFWEKKRQKRKILEKKI